MNPTYHTPGCISQLIALEIIYIALGTIAGTTVGALSMNGIKEVAKDALVGAAIGGYLAPMEILTEKMLFKRISVRNPDGSVLVHPNTNEPITRMGYQNKDDFAVGKLLNAIHLFAVSLIIVEFAKKHGMIDERVGFVVQLALGYLAFLQMELAALADIKSPYAGAISCIGKIVYCNIAVVKLGLSSPTTYTLTALQTLFNLRGTIIKAKEAHEFPRFEADWVRQEQRQAQG